MKLCGQSNNFQKTFAAISKACRSARVKLPFPIAHQNSFSEREVETGQLVRMIDGHAGRVNPVAFSPDGETLVTAGADHTTKSWRLDSGQETAAFKGHTEE